MKCGLREVGRGTKLFCDVLEELVVEVVGAVGVTQSYENNRDGISICYIILQPSVYSRFGFVWLRWWVVTCWSHDRAIVFFTRRSVCWHVATWWEPHWKWNERKKHDPTQTHRPLTPVFFVRKKDKYSYVVARIGVRQYVRKMYVDHTVHHLMRSTNETFICKMEKSVGNVLCTFVVIIRGVKLHGGILSQLHLCVLPLIALSYLNHFASKQTSFPECCVP